MIRTIIVILFILYVPDPARAFGPHSDGTVGNAIDRAELPRGFPIYQDYEAPFSYSSMTRRDLNPMVQEDDAVEVEGSSEMTGFFIPVGFFMGLGPTSGLSVDVKDRSIRAAIEDAKKRYGVGHLYDVRIDVRYFSILGVYNKTTTIIHAKAVRESTPPLQKGPHP
ncbi:MAG TPA: hypothetical protein VLY20_04650 [Nitrospiria bacterium]|nr:hypothetical protein [Nitrospiria bacterium]